MADDEANFGLIPFPQEGGKSCGIIEYLDLQSLLDNSRVVEDEVHGEFQPLVLDETEVPDAVMSQIKLDNIEADHALEEAEEQIDLSQVDMDKLVNELQPGDNPKHVLELVSDAKMEENATKTYLEASIHKARWAQQIFEQWQRICNFNTNHNPDGSKHVITGTLMDMTNEYLCLAMCKFVMEIKKQNGELYPKETLYKIILALQLHLEMNGHTVRFLDDDKFKHLLNTLDNRIKELSKLGVVHPKE